MNSAQRLDYIFAYHANCPVGSRFPWLKTALLGDIQTFIDGIDLFLRGKKKATLTKPRGGGNVALTIPVNTALELAASVYFGKTDYTRHRKANATGSYNVVPDSDGTQRVKQFIEDFFPRRSSKIPQLLWDGIRNGVDHTFMPNGMQRRKRRIRFQFFVEPKNEPSRARVANGEILIRINSLEYYKIVKQAIKNYEQRLRVEPMLQVRFVKAWKSYERHKVNLDKRGNPKKPEADELIEWTRSHTNVTLFR